MTKVTMHFTIPATRNSRELRAAIDKVSDWLRARKVDSRKPLRGLYRWGTYDGGQYIVYHQPATGKWFVKNVTDIYRAASEANAKTVIRKAAVYLELHRRAMEISWAEEGLFQDRPRRR